MPPDSLAARRASSAETRRPAAPADDARAGGPSKNGLEWTVFAVSLALVAFVAGALFLGHGTAQDGPPRLDATLGAPVPLPGGGVRVPVALTNAGGQTVEGASVEVTDGATIVPLDFGYAPRGARLDGAALFDSLAGPLAARVVGYTLP